MAHTKERRKNRVAVPADEARANFGELLDRAGFRGERIVITRHAKDAAVLVSIDDLRRLEEGEAA